MRKLSELEGVSLGIIYKLQPCTAYRVRCVLKDSPSSHWRASAGSVYPLLTRLEAENHVSAVIDKGDGRGRKFLTLSNQGLASLRKWVGDGTQTELVSAIFDPIRSRMFFLQVLNADERKSYVDKLIVLMETYLASIIERHEQGKEIEDDFDRLGAMGAIMGTEARLEWLKVVRKQLTEYK